MDVQRLAVDVHQLLYGRAILHKSTFISFSMDVQHDISGRRPVYLWTYNVWQWPSTIYYMDVNGIYVQRLAVDVYQLLYGRAILHKWTLISFSMDVQHDISGRPPVSLWTYNVWSWPSTLYYMDVQHFISVCPYFLMDVRHDIRGRPPVST